MREAAARGRGGRLAACWRGVGRGPDGDGGPEIDGGEVRQRRARCGRGGEGWAGAGDDANLARLIVATGTERAGDMWAGAILLGLAHVHAEQEQNARRTADDVRGERERYVSFR